LLNPTIVDIAAIANKRDKSKGFISKY
jgi:hypothetical protein